MSNQVETDKILALAELEKIEGLLTALRADLGIVQPQAKHSGFNGIHNPNMDISQHGDFTTATNLTTNDTSELAQNIIAAENIGTAIWAESGSSIPETSDWDGTAFGAEGLTTSTGGWRIIHQGCEDFQQGRVGNIIQRLPGIGLLPAVR